MTKKDVQKLAEEYVMKHKEHYGTVPKRELKQAVDKVAKVLGDLTVKADQDEPSRKARAKAA